MYSFFFFFFLNFILHMRNFEDFIIEISDGKFIINLSYFSNPEAFNSYLLDFLVNYATTKKDINNEYIILDLEFSNGYLEMSGFLFMFPYVDKELSFYDIYDVYLCNLNSDSIYLRISII